MKNFVHCFLLIILMSLQIFALGNDEKSVQTRCRATEENCDFYLCKENESKCGKSGYWIGFGHKYCETFVKNNDRFSQNTQNFFRKVRFCLQDEARYIDKKFTCEQVSKEALGSHSDCYLESGFCSLTLAERMHVIWYIRKELLTPMTYLTGLEVELGCSN